MKIIQEILKYLELYFIYLYPGFITIFFYSFTKVKSLKFNKTLIMTSVIISYIYVLIYRWIRGFNTLLDFNVIDYIIILFISIIIPFVWHWISRSYPYNLPYLHILDRTIDDFS